MTFRRYQNCPCSRAANTETPAICVVRRVEKELIVERQRLRFINLVGVISFQDFLFAIVELSVADERPQGRRPRRRCDAVGRGASGLESPDRAIEDGFFASAVLSRLEWRTTPRFR